MKRATPNCHIVLCFILVTQNRVVLGPPVHWDDRAKIGFVTLQSKGALGWMLLCPLLDNMMLHCAAQSKENNKARATIYSPGIYRNLTHAALLRSYR